MSGTRSRAESGTNGRKQLLSAASQLFSEQGYAEVTITSLVELAGVKAPSLYHHYKGKEGLYMIWCHEALESMGSRIEAVRLDKSDVYAYLSRLQAVLVADGTPNLLQILKDRQLLPPEMAEEITRFADRFVFEAVAAELESIVGASEASDVAAVVVRTLAASADHYLVEQNGVDSLFRFVESGILQSQNVNRQAG